MAIDNNGDEIIFECENCYYYVVDLRTINTKYSYGRIINKYDYKLGKFEDVVTHEVKAVTPETLKECYNVDMQIDDIIGYDEEKGGILYTDRSLSIIKLFSFRNRHSIIIKSLYKVDYIDNNYYLVDHVTGEIKDLDLEYLKKCKNEKLVVDGTIGLVLLGANIIEDKEKEICDEYLTEILTYSLIKGVAYNNLKVRLQVPVDKFIFDNRISLIFDREKVSFAKILEFLVENFCLARCELNRKLKKTGINYYIYNGELYIGFCERKRKERSNVELYKIKDLHEGYCNSEIIVDESEFIDFEELKIV